MYESFYGLSGKPFSLLPDGDCLFLSKRHRRIMNLLEYGIVMEAGFVVITGEVGAGKTTVVRRFLKNVGPEMTVGVISNPTASIGRLLNWIAAAFDLKDRHGDDATLHSAFVDFLLAQYAQGKRTILIIDEAQNLPAEKLEELRMLSNVNNERDMLLQVLLVGQPELLGTLKRPDLRQFVQRVSVHCHLTPLQPAETAEYIAYRLGVVGGTKELFDDVSCAVVHHFSGGVPRLINLLCDQALVYGFSEDKETISYDIIVEIAMDRDHFGLSPFKNVPKEFSHSELMIEVTDLVGEIARARANRGVGE